MFIVSVVNIFIASVVLERQHSGGPTGRAGETPALRENALFVAPASRRLNAWLARTLALRENILVARAHAGQQLIALAFQHCHQLIKSIGEELAAFIEELPGHGVIIDAHLG